MIDKYGTRACAVRRARNVAGIQTNIAKGARSAPDSTIFKKKTAANLLTRSFLQINLSLLYV